MALPSLTTRRALSVRKRTDAPDVDEEHGPMVNRFQRGPAHLATPVWPAHQRRNRMTPPYALHKPHHPDNDVPDEFEPGAPPVEPDEGPVPTQVPDDPEHERVVDPADNLA